MGAQLGISDFRMVRIHAVLPPYLRHALDAPIESDGEAGCAPAPDPPQAVAAEVAGGCHSMPMSIVFPGLWGVAHVVCWRGLTMPGSAWA
eukprot:5255907-Alexandrium_andersonii.AAC.1